MKIDSIRVGFIATNCYLLCDEEAGVCALLDPGDTPEQGADMVSRSGPNQVRSGQGGVHPADPRSL